MLKKDLGKGWYQLAIAMGMPKTHIDSIQEQADVTLVWKIDTFLAVYKFPSFGSNKEKIRETAEFLLEALVTASLPNVAMDVKRHLELVLNIEGTQCFCMHPCVTLSEHK